MYLYTEAKKRIRFENNSTNKIGGEVYGDVFKISEDICLKVYKYAGSVNEEILAFLKTLKLKNYYKIYDFYYNKEGSFKAHTMKFYQPEEIDILTVETNYTLANLSNLLQSVDTLNQNNVVINDTHAENVILDRNNITVIDTDLYSFNRFYSQFKLEIENLHALTLLFESLYLDALKKYHPEHNTYVTINTIKDIFKLYGQYSREDTYRRLSQYKYPIDYIRKRIK